MASVEQAIREILVASAVNGMVAGKIRPLNAAQDEARPYVLFAMSAVEPIDTFDGPCEWEKTSVEVTSYADTYKAVLSLCQACRAALHHYAGTAGGLDIAPCLMTEETSVETVSEPGMESPVYVRTQTYRLLNRPTQE
ncbi:MAG: hypothetical protein JWO31_3282 [Phycisphaerales bacterium]|nr:hypothetical protein [Phycisphaerales bacterium]